MSAVIQIVRDFEAALVPVRALDEMLAAAGDGVHAFDEQCRYIYWSATMERLSGKSAASVLDAVAFDAFPFLRENGQEKCFREALAGRSSSALDCVFHIPESGKRGHYDAFYSPLRAPDGAVIGGVAIIRETTERRRALAELRETEARFRIMADAAPVLLWMAGTDSLCTFFNQTWLDFTGRSLEQEWGVGWAEGVHFEDFQRCMDTYVSAFNARRPFEMEYRLRRRDGEFRWVLDRGAPRFTPDGQFAGYIGSCIDITEKRHIEIELRAAVQMRDEFLSIASHELRTPLTALHLQLETMQRLTTARPAEPERLTKTAAVALSQGRRLATLIDQLLDMSRLASGRVALDRSELDLSALVNEVVARFSPALEERGMPIELRVEPGVSGRWDRLRVDQVLTNLVTNAVKYGGGKPITIELVAAPGRARLVVRDRGIGIAPEHQQRIFERFERAVSPHNYGGFGLGLWIARQLVEAHGGRISVESAVGQGSAFTVELPV
jgi:PAS domain S-box-containing protein